ncbi:hypothetical protein AB4Z43_02205 [Mesorhizobium sp. 2RAF45]|uniref:hypothetical protein n=1 Tax=Mesorhizobium sp. 2RAF45 TaxID=3233001 RepID=UPI003F94F443
MATLNAAHAANERRIGFPTSRGKTVARRLQDEDILPSGQPGKAPEIDLRNYVDLVLALAADTTLRAVANAVANYRELTPAGTPIEALPASLQYSAGNYLDSLADLAAEGSQDVRRIKLEVVSTWPEIAVHHDDGTVRRFVQPGANPSHWQHSGHRRSTTISGAAFADCILVLFGEKKS